MRRNMASLGCMIVLVAAQVLTLAPTGCEAGLLGLQEPSLAQQQTHQQVHGVLRQLPQASSSSSSSSSSAQRTPADTLQQQQPQPQQRRSLQGFRPSQDEQHTKHDASMSGGHVFGVTLLCLLAMAALGFIGWKAMQWYERVKRPGYVELQALDTAFFKPTFTL